MSHARQQVPALDVRGEVLDELRCGGDRLVPRADGHEVLHALARLLPRFGFRGAAQAHHLAARADDHAVAGELLLERREHLLGPRPLALAEEIVDLIEPVRLAGVLKLPQPRLPLLVVHERDFADLFEQRDEALVDDRLGWRGRRRVVR